MERPKFGPLEIQLDLECPRDDNGSLFLSSWNVQWTILAVAHIVRLTTPKPLARITESHLIFDLTEHAMRRLRLNASTVGVDRGRWRLTDRSHEGAVAHGDRSVARHPEASVGDRRLRPDRGQVIDLCDRGRRPPPQSWSRSTTAATRSTGSAIGASLAPSARHAFDLHEQSWFIQWKCTSASDRRKQAS